MSELKTVRVSILNKSYQVNCKEDEVAALQRSASYLDQKMREMKKQSSVIGLDHLAIMAALNLTNDLLAQTDQTTQLSSQQLDLTDQLSGHVREIKQLEEKLAAALSRLKSDVKE